MRQTQYIVLFIITLSALISKGQLRTETISENVSHLSFLGTSVKATLITSGSDAILVDTMYDTLAIEIKKLIDKEGLKLKYIINTHYHGDHTDGNRQFKDAIKIAHQNTQNLIEDKAPYGPPEAFTVKDYPSLLFEEQMTLFLNDLRLEVVHYGSGHTTGDAIVFIPSSNIVIVGDLILDAKNTLPFFPIPEDGLSVLEKLLENIDDDTQIINGHGSIGNKDDISELISIIKTTLEYVKSGNDLEQFPEEWKIWDSNFLTMTAWLKMLGKHYK